MKLVDLEKRLEVVKKAGALDGEILSITPDSRDVEQNSLFVALSGLEIDGHDFIGDAVLRGAKAFLVERIPDSLMSNNVLAETGVLVVPDTRKALGVASSCFYGDPSKNLSVTGVTGTNGKTTISYLLESILNCSGFSVGVLGTINNRLGEEIMESNLTTPAACEIQELLRKMLRRGVSHCVMEVSSHALDQNRAWGTNFRLCVFTNLTHDHLDYHQNMESYMQAKERLFTEYDPEFSIVNIDDRAGALIAEKARGKLVTYSLEGNADLTGEVIDQGVDGITLAVQTSAGGFRARSALIGKHNAYNILAAVAVALSEGISQEKIIQGIESLKAVPGRLEPVDEGQNFSLFVDYAHTPDALKNVLTALGRLAKKRVITLFGCGGDRDREKRGKMGRVALSLSDYVVITSDNPRKEDPMKIINEVELGISAVSGKVCAYTTICDRAEAISHAVTFAGKDDIVLIAGKGHEEYQIIGEEKFHFDDREVARSVLRSIG